MKDVGPAPLLHSKPFRFAVEGYDGLQSGWSLDGRSLLARRPSGSSVLVDSLTQGLERAPWATVRCEREATVEQKAALFGSGNDPRLITGLPVVGPHASASR